MGGDELRASLHHPRHSQQTLVWSAWSSSCCLYTSEGSTVIERGKQKEICSGRWSFGARLTAQEGWCHQWQWQVSVPSLHILGIKRRVQVSSVWLCLPLWHFSQQKTKALLAPMLLLEAPRFSKEKRGRGSKNMLSIVKNRTDIQELLVPLSYEQQPLQSRAPF